MYFAGTELLVLGRQRAMQKLKVKDMSKQEMLRVVGGQGGTLC